MLHLDVVCFVDNVSVIRNLNTPYTQIQDPMCRENLYQQFSKGS